MDGYTDRDSNRRNAPSTLLATATSIKISREQLHDDRSQQFVAIMVPHSMVEYSLQRTVFNRPTVAAAASGRASKQSSTASSSSSPTCRWLEQADRLRLSRDLLPRIHSIFATTRTGAANERTPTTSTPSNITSGLLSWNILGGSSSLAAAPSRSSPTSSHSPILIRAIFSTCNNKSAADVVLLDVPSSFSMTPSEMLLATNGDGMADAPDHILKMLIVSQVHIASSPMNLLTSVASLEIPLCPVCLHRIDPVRLGLPKPQSHHLCSKFCPTGDDDMLEHDTVAALSTGEESKSSFTFLSACPKQRFLRPWPEPSHCVACSVIRDYQTVGAATHHMSPVYCNQCALQKTLWVCLTCGFCGCGRYSNKHAEAHFLNTGHNYSLELATLRIWDYASADGEFAHRADLLDCPSGRRQRARAMQLQQEMLESLGDTWEGTAGVARSATSSTEDWGDGADNSRYNSYVNGGSVFWEQQQPYFWPDQGGDEKSPKKAVMIGEEYEALLQSALEDQEQHYQGEISRLRALLTAEQVDMDSLTKEEVEIIESLKAEIAELSAATEKVSRELLDVQAQEAGFRANSTRLLREQQVAQDLLKKIHDESKGEQDEYRRQVDELEQQIADLTGNLRMKQQFSQNQELSNATVFGTTTSPDAPRDNSKKAKLRRFLGRK